LSDSAAPASADATLGQKSENHSAEHRRKPLFPALSIYKPKMLTPTLTYINCHAKLGKS